MYQLTLPDIMILCILGMLILIIALAWPRDGSIDIRERGFVMGVNAFRVEWDGETGQHKIQIMLERAFDNPPKVNDVIFITETNGDSIRNRVIDAQPIKTTVVGDARNYTTTLTTVPIAQ